MNQKFLDLCRKCAFVKINGYRYFPHLFYYPDHPADVRKLLCFDANDDASSLEILEDELKQVFQNAGWSGWIIPESEAGVLNIQFYKEVELL